MQLFWTQAHLYVGALNQAHIVMSIGEFHIRTLYTNTFTLCDSEFSCKIFFVSPIRERETNKQQKKYTHIRCLSVTGNCVSSDSRNERWFENNYKSTRITANINEVEARNKQKQKKTRTHTICRYMRENKGCMAIGCYTPTILCSPEVKSLSWNHTALLFVAHTHTHTFAVVMMRHTSTKLYRQFSTCFGVFFFSLLRFVSLFYGIYFCMVLSFRFLCCRSNRSFRSVRSFVLFSVFCLFNIRKYSNAWVFRFSVLSAMFRGWVLQREMNKKKRENKMKTLSSLHIVCLHVETWYLRSLKFSLCLWLILYV